MATGCRAQGRDQAQAAGRSSAAAGVYRCRGRLNLQFAGVLVNYDLPWNPMKVEQRIGRIGVSANRVR